ncbi:tyrosine-type recombinase/integrase [Paenibacillus sp.]|uniref:tyrosine-type recombinase/integrase n=1 Tax=Paenibacillus sp. TaxID=58172 RepID=UPI002D5FF788|nr:tyrosine-type recombinase/integrase [Paenibacillus sp.]HZG57102.1 tyrosine-type recombinase/integrase [Paenibacillus sp.]
MNTILDGYKQYLESQHKEPATIRAYLHEAEGFLGWCSVRNAGLSELSQQTFAEYRDALAARGAKPATVNKSVSTLSTFFKWAQANGLAGENFAKRLRLPQGKKEETPRWLTAAEEAALLAAVERETTEFQRVRNTALLCAMLYGGVKVDEIPELPIDAIEGDTLHVYDRGERIRSVPLPPFAAEKLRAWLRLRRASAKEAHASSDALFVTERSGRMQTRAVQFVVETYSDRIGTPITSQMLRNTFCRRHAESGATVERLKALAGHKTLLTTWKYYREK